MTASVLAGPSMKPMPAPARTTNQICEPKSRLVTLSPQSQNPTAASAQPRHDRPLRADPVEHPPADLRGDDEADEEVQEDEARRGRRLAERDLRVLAGEEEHRDEDEHRDPEHDVLDHERPDPEDAHLDQRRLVPRSTKTNTTRSSSADDDAGDRPGLLQPQMADCWKPKTLSATPAAISTSPR